MTHGLTFRARSCIPRAMLIYKLLRTGEWADLQARGKTDGAPVDVADGYIHFSTAAQVRETAAKYFSGEAGVMLLAYESDALGEALKWEPSRGGALFPHLYRRLELAEMLWARELPLTPDGHSFPEDLA